MLASLFAARFFCFDRQSVETGSRVVCGLSNERERSVVNGVINRVFRRPTPRGRRNPAVCNPVRNAERRSRSYHGSGDGKWAQGGWRIGWKTAAVARAPANAANAEQGG